LVSYEAGLARRPDLPSAQFGLACCHLLNGDFVRGWQSYEGRWNTADLGTAKRRFVQPLWLGAEDIAGKTILLHAEQGFGDTLHFCRYVPLAAARGAHVILEVPSALRELMRTLPCEVQIVSQGGPLPAFDMHCPLLSLPLAFGTRIDTIPAQVPYLSATGAAREVWRDRVGSRDNLKVGLVWAGAPRKFQANANRHDRQRSIRFDQLSPILDVEGCDFYSLQKGDEAVAQLHDSARRDRVIDWTNDLRDFTDTAGLIENLDLVITVDTSVAHLTGALGKPLWLLNRYDGCWRWLLDRDDSPWYPGARLFRQDETREWEPVIAQLSAALKIHLRDGHKRSV
jgi:hypothetical protein